MSDRPGPASRAEDVVAFLQLVADGASPGAADGLAKRLLARGDAHDALVEQCRQLAVRALASRAPSGVVDLPAELMDSLRELLEVSTDVEPVLQVVVDRARRLLRCDFAYLNLIRPESSTTYTRVMSGARTDRWRSLTIPFGVGIGGRVAATAQPFATANYLLDDRLQHTPDVDAAADAEGQLAIMAVPLVRQGRVHGVLFASNRTSGPFSTEALNTLLAFAALAAVVLDRGELLASAQRDRAELAATVEAMHRQTDLVQRNVEAHDRAMDVVLAGGGLDDVVAAAVQFLGGAVVVADATGAVAAMSAGTPPGTVQLVLDRVRSDLPMERPPVPADQDAVWVSPLLAGAERLGSLSWVPDPGAPTSGESDRRLLERTGVLASLVLLFQRDLAAAEQRVRGGLLDDLLRGDVAAAESLYLRSGSAGYALDAQQSVLVAHTDIAHRGHLEAVASQIALDRRGLSTTLDGHVVLVVPDLGAGRPADLLLRQRVPTAVTVGVCSVDGGVAGVAAAYRQAEACLGTLLRLGRAGTTATAADLGFVGLLLGPGASPDSFVQRTLGPVLEHDDRRHSVLLATLRAYFASGQSLATSAADLHVHVNTVSQRLTRVRQLLSVDLADPEHALEIQLALRLHQAAPGGGADPEHP